MKQLSMGVALVALAFTSYAAEPAEKTEKWLVATTVSADTLLSPAIDVPELRRSPLREEMRERVSTRFRHVRGFSIEMTESEAREMEKSPVVRWVERDLPRTLLAESAFVQELVQTNAPQQTPYGISMVRAPEIWNRTRGRAVKVGVVDTGIDLQHPDLLARYRGGWDFVNHDADPQDDHGHGTHVAGTIAATDNGLGVVGIAPEADLYALKVLDRRGSGTTETLIKAVEWAIDHDLDVINLSLGSPNGSLLEEEAFDRAEAAGVIAVAASGNDYRGLDELGYPAGYRSVISVGAVDSVQAIASFSQRGINLDFVAPGVGVESTTFRSYYALVSSDGKILSGEPMAFSPNGSLSGELVDCGIGLPGQFPASVRGRIALIERGQLSFAEKATNARLAGAVGAVIYNHHPDEHPEGGVIRGTLGEIGNWIITVGVSRSAGQHLLSLADRRVDLGLKSASEYGKLNGTSMATPHVAGAIAILRSIAPDASTFALVEALRSSAIDLGDPGRDGTFGNGRIDLFEAAAVLSPAPSTETGSRRRSVRPPADGD